MAKDKDKQEEIPLEEVENEESQTAYETAWEEIKKQREQTEKK